MGCWNQTCGISQLHIRAGQKVMVVPLVQSPRDSLCYTTPFWSPFPVPFYSEYNDYGGGENSSGIGLELAMNHIKRVLIEVEQGENKYHDIPVTRETFDEEKFWDAIHEQRLTVNNVSWSKKTPVDVGMVMIHMDVFNHLAENFEFESTDYINNKITYYKYKLQDILNDVPAFVDYLFASMDKDGDVAELLESIRQKNLDEEAHKTACRRVIQLCCGIKPTANEMRARPGTTNSYKNRLTNAEGFNRAADWLTDYPSHMSYSNFSVGLIDVFADPLITGKDREGLIELLSDFIRLLFIDSFMMHSRKHWSPQAGAGSQSDDDGAYLALNAAVAFAIEKDKTRWDEDEDEDEDEE